MRDPQPVRTQYARICNSLAIGECVDLALRQLIREPFNWQLYDDAIHSLRGVVIGSNYGTHRYTKYPQRDVLRVERLAESLDPIYDRDGRHIPSRPVLEEEIYY